MKKITQEQAQFILGASILITLSPPPPVTFSFCISAIIFGPLFSPAILSVSNPPSYKTQCPFSQAPNYDLHGGEVEQVLCGNITALQMI